MSMILASHKIMQLSETTSALLWCTSCEHAQSLVSMTDPAAVVDAINAAFVSIQVWLSCRDRSTTGQYGDYLKVVDLILFGGGGGGGGRRGGNRAQYIRLYYPSHTVRYPSSK